MVCELLKNQYVIILGRGTEAKCSERSSNGEIIPSYGRGQFNKRYSCIDLKSENPGDRYKEKAQPALMENMVREAIQFAFQKRKFARTWINWNFMVTLIII